MDKLEKTLEIVIVIVITLLVIGSIWFIYETKEMLNDHRCYELPLDEFFQDKKCEKYWRYRK